MSGDASVGRRVRNGATGVVDLDGESHYRGGEILK